MKAAPLFALAVAIAPWAAAAPDCAPAMAARTDLAAMRDGVAAQMAYRPGGNVPVGRIYDGLVDWAENAVSDADRLRLYERFVFDLGDHHVSLNTNADASRRLVPSGATVWVEWRDEGLVVTSVRPGSPAAAQGLRAGMWISTIDGVPVQWDLSAPPSTPARETAMKGFGGRVALAGRHNKDAVVRAVEGRRALMVTLAPMPPGPSEPVSLSFPQAGVALLRLNNSLGSDALPAAFDAAMAQAVGSQTILLDLRDTPSGGDALYAKALMAWFVKGERAYQRHRQGKKTWNETVVGRADGFRGKLLVLVDRWTGSMGEGVAIGLRSAAGAKLVGTPMAGLRGAMGGVELPCFGATLRIPVEQLFSVDGRPREEAKPDILISEQDLAAAPLGEDVILARALDVGAPLPH